MKTLEAATAEQWRKWLEEHHDTASEIWLIFWKRHTGKQCIDYESSVEAAICFGWIDSIIKSIDKDSYARKFTPRIGKSNWSALNRERAIEMIRSGEMTDPGMDAVKTARENGAWYLRSKPVEMPSELEEELDNNPEAAMFFSELAPSYRKQYMGWIDEAVKPEIRYKRAEEAVRLLANHSRLPLK
ncbi:MAG: YdeI/OmpD-associated family protein [Candidatus Sabulitectum sp.]|nr:YdeI/OmpD-associated family protein [Candidatus Sabulitectum sp.]